MDRGNPYETAFEAYLKAQGLGTVAVDETRRTLWGNTSVKNLDFIVLSRTGTRLLVDVKGRQFPGGPAGKERYVWENWSTQEDLYGMANWIRLFRAGLSRAICFSLSHWALRELAGRHSRPVDLARPALPLACRHGRGLPAAHEGSAAPSGVPSPSPEPPFVRWPGRSISSATNTGRICRKWNMSLGWNRKISHGLTRIKHG